MLLARSLGIALIATNAVVSTSCNSAVIHVASVEFDKDTSVVLKDHTKTLNLLCILIMLLFQL